MIEALFVILLTFVADAHSAKTEAYECSNQWCVDQIVEQARESTTLRRLRVFDRAPAAVDRSLGLQGPTIFPPILDISYD